MNKNQNNKTQSRKALKAKLVYGDIPKIASLLEIHRTTIYDWFNGKNNRNDIETAVKEFVKTKSRNLETRIEELKAELK